MASIFKPGLFDGHVALITGGGTGIGLATAHTMGELGAKVAICGRKQERLDAAVKELAGRGIVALGKTCDIREPEQVAALVDAVAAELGPISVLVNNAGGQFPTTAEQITTRGWEAVIKNNLNGTFFVTQAVGTKCMIPRKRGRIVNVIANIARGFPGMVHTGAARAGVDNMTKTLAVEWAQFNIQVNAIAPGVIKSTGTEQYPPHLVEMSRLRTPMKRLGTPEECAELIAYMACDAAYFVTGETWYIDGGAHLWGDTWVMPDDAHVVPPVIAKLAEK
jgi:citronellol/citronellal dehydrogenase